MGCGESTVKYLLFIFNLIFALAGLALLGIGVAGLLKVEAIVKLLKGDDRMLPILAISVGSLVFFVAFFGCCGAIVESDCMLITFSVFMLLLIIVKIAVIVVMFAVKGILEKISKGIMILESVTPPVALAAAKQLRLYFCGICALVGALELIGMVFGCCLANHVRSKMRGHGRTDVIMMR